MAIESRAGNITLDSLFRPMEQVRERLRRTVAALESARVPYAMVGGNAVQAWVASIDPAAIRNTKDVDILLRRTDLPAAASAMASAGFVHRHVAGVDMFLDGPNGRPKEGIHIVFAGEKVRPQYPSPAPRVEDSVMTRLPQVFRVITLEMLVQMKLTSFRLLDKVHLIDMLDVELIDAGWCERLPTALSDRLREVIEQWKSEQR